MDKIELIVKEISKKYENYTEIFLNNSVDMGMVYYYNMHYDIVIGILLKRCEDVNIRGKVEVIYVFAKDKNCYYINDEKIETIDPLYVLNKPPAKSYGDLDKIQAFVSLWDELVFIKNEPYLFNSITVLEKLYKTKEVLKTTGKLQKKIDKLTEYPLKTYKIKDFTKTNEYQVKNTVSKYGSSFIKNSTKIELIKDDLFVVRMFVLKNKPIEIFRFYINNDEVIKCKKNNIGDWVNSSRLVLSNYSFAFDAKDLGEEFNNTRLGYYMDIIKNAQKKSSSIKFVLMMVENPFLEQFYKSGFDKYLINRSSALIAQDNVKDFAEYYLGYYDEKAKNVFAKLGWNSYQAEKIKQVLFGYEDEDFIKILRKVLGNNFAAVDNETFDRMFNVISFVKNNNKRFHFAWNFLGLSGGLIKLNKSREYIITFFEELILKSELLVDLTRYSDYIYMISRMDEAHRESFKLKFDNREDLFNAHDNIIGYINSMKDEIAKKKFNERIKEWKKFVFENDDFVITYPKEASDIANEGIELRHCVKSYIEKVSQGETNIFFLRKIDEPNKPYFTIEVTNQLEVRQIHGFCNCNLKKNSEEYEFVQKWAKEKKLNIANINRVLAAG